MFYDILKEECKKKKTSPSAVCVALGISKSNASNWKRGRTSPTLDTVFAIADELKVNPKRFVER
jgi:transcriptional regulator with XRE-family HTH domain